MTIEARRVHRGVSGALLALALVLLAAAPVAQADTIYPINQAQGASFDNGSADGFADAGSDCTLLVNLLPIVIPGVVCEVDNQPNATDGAGDPPGSLESKYRTVADGLAIIPPLTLLQGNGLYQSTPFTISRSGPTTLSYDRRAILNALLAIGGQGSYTISLVDESTSTSTPLASETLQRNALINEVDTTWQTLTGAATTVTGGHTYRLDIRTQFQDQLVVAAQSTFTFRFDNIRLRVADGTTTFVSKPTVFTDDATDLDDTSAVLNGKVRPEGLFTTYQFRYGTDQAAVLAGTAAATPPGAVGTQTTLQPIDRRVTGLTKCTTYFFRIEATNSVGTSVGVVKSFGSDCEPKVITEDATAVGPNGAQLNSKINPGGRATQYQYIYRVKGTGPFLLTPLNALPDDTLDHEPNGVPISGLAPTTTYEFRIVASNSLGITNGLLKEFTTSGTGATGPTGPTGPQGAQGGTGPQGPAGANGTNGAPGPAGPAGARGPSGAAGVNGQSLPDAESSSRLAMVRIDATRISVPTKGRNIGRVRVQIFCRRIAVRTCSGTMKIRSLNKIKPQSFGFPVKAVRRVTFSTAPVQLDVGKVGFAIFDFNAQRRSVLRRESPVRSEVIVTVIDANNNRQNVRKVVTVVRGGRA
jgi:hypothetical protein